MEKRTLFSKQIDLEDQSETVSIGAQISGPRVNATCGQYVGFLSKKTIIVGTLK